MTIPPGGLHEALRGMIPGRAARALMPELVRFAEAEGIAPTMRALGAFTVDDLCAALEADPGYALSRGNRARMIRLLVELFAETKRVVRDGADGRWRWRPPTGGASGAAVGAAARGAEEDGELRFLRLCLRLAPAYLRGGDPSITFGPGSATAWDDFLGCADFQACRTVLLDAMAEGAAPGARLLDLCHGPGWGIERALDRWPDARVTAIDFTDAFAGIARGRADRALERNRSRGTDSPPVAWAGPAEWRGLGEPLPFPDGSFDAILFGCGDPYIPPASREAVYADLRRVLAPGGRLGILTRGLPDAARAHVAGRTFRVAALVHDFCESVCAGWEGFSDVSECIGLFGRVGFRDGWPSSGGMASFGSSIWFLGKE